MQILAQDGRLDRKWSKFGKSLLGVVLILCNLLLISAPVAATVSDSKRPNVKLILVADPGCPYCARWEEEVGKAYAASEEGRFAPLERRERDDPEVKKFGNIIYSPTFILVRDGVEVGRIVGYPGPDFFWGLLGKLLEQAGFAPNSGAS
jgi:hypothetical protein|nr:MAG: hypothetical protein DIU57_17750 [Pseudomonadota bacterium]